MTRPISRKDFVDLFLEQKKTMDDVTRRNANLLTAEPMRNSGGTLTEMSQTVAQSTAWEPIAFLQAWFTTLGAPVLLASRFRVSSITASTTVRFSYMIDGVEVTGNNYGLGEVNSLTFQPLIEITHVVTNLPAANHSIIAVARLVDATGGKSATLYGGVQERITMMEVK